MLSINDNSTGITDENLAAFYSLGILGMQERAEMLGGTLSVTRLREGGTLVTVQLPENAEDAYETACADSDKNSHR